MFHELRNSNGKLFFLSGFPLLPWPPGGQARSLTYLCQSADWILSGARPAQVTARSTLPETQTLLITDHGFCSPCNNMHPASFPHCFQFLHLSLCTLWSSFLCSFPWTFIPFNLPSALHPGVLQNSGMWDIIPHPHFSFCKGLIDYFQVSRLSCILRSRKGTAYFLSFVSRKGS